MMSERLKRYRFGPAKIRLFTWAFPIASLLVGAAIVIQQYVREAGLRAEFKAVAAECMRLEQGTGMDAHEGHHH
jgi:hypothetical protein